VFPLHWGITTQYFSEVAPGYADCVRVAFAFLMESILIEAIDN
jgi:hypothetical protein